MYPSIYALTDGSKPPERRLIVVEGESVDPLMVRYSGGNSSQAIYYRIWVGREGGDDRGFEEGCSLFKWFTTRSPTHDELQRWHSSVSKDTVAVWMPASQKPSSISQPARSSNASSYSSHFKGNGHVDKPGVSRKPPKILRPRASISAPQRFQPSRTPETRRGDFLHWPQTVGKRKRAGDEEEDADSLLSSFLSPAAEKIPASLKAKPSELAEHVNNNVVLIFYPQDEGAPRVRLLGGCDNVQKLFSQALAGDVFGDGAGLGTKVLALTFEGGQQKSRSFVEDDDQDYDDLVTALKRLDCWFVEDGALQGSLTVEVKAK